MTGLLPQISWLAVGNLLGLLAVVLVIPLLILGFRRIKRRLGLAQSSVSDASQIWSTSPGFAAIRGILFVLALACLVIASAGPRWGWTWVESKQSGVDIVVAVDVSKSMLARDLDPNRLERARRMMIDLLDVADGDRIGLVVFAGAAFVQCPLTVDHGAMRSFVDGLSTDMIPVGGTDLAGALRESLNALDAGGEKQGLGKLIVLMTDGEDHIGGIDTALAEVVASKAKVVTVGLASPEGAPVVDDAGGFIKDQRGDVVVSRLNEEPLKKIAEATGGVYLNASRANDSIAAFYQDVIHAKGTVRETQAKRERLWYERFQWVAALAMILLLIENFIRDVRPPSAAGIVLLLMCLFPSHQSQAADSARERYNAAVAAFEAGDAENARKEFLELAQSGDGEEKRRSLYNLGNILAASGQLDEAVKFYEDALAMNYQDQQVRDNLAWAKKKSESAKNEKRDNQEKNQSKSNEQKNKEDGKQDQSKQQQEQAQDQQSSKSESKENKESSKSTNDQPKPSEDEQTANQHQKTQPGNKQESGQQADASKAKDILTPEEAEKLLRAAPDDRRTFVPIFRSGKTPPPSRQGKDW